MAREWTLDDVPLALVAPNLVAGREDLFYAVTAASLVESGADIYAANLVTFFEGDGEVNDWLRRRWQVEEVNHGRVLRAYVGRVWPEFDWQRAYAEFLADYARLCTVGNLEATRSRELAARCVVETGTATFYRALAAQAGEPVLAGIAGRISAQEVDHYKHFYAYFRAYRARESTGRLEVATTLARRTLAARHSDADLALRHAFAVRSGADDARRYRALGRRLERQLGRHYPLGMATKMLVKPLALPAWLAHAVCGPLATAIAWLLNLSA